MTTTEDLARIARMHATLALREHALRPATPLTPSRLARPVGARTAPRQDAVHRAARRAHAGLVPL